jgi:dTDP-4-dehydrorhamnose reductase
MVKALVVGAGGGLGRALQARLAPPLEVVALSRAQLDVSRRNDVIDRVREVRPDVIFDCAGFTNVDACEVDRWQAYLVNRDGAEHLARAAADAGALVVYVSSDLIFDGAKSGPYREEDSPNPLSIYGDTKLAAELAIMSHAPRHLIVRTGWLYGPYGRSYVSELLEWRRTQEVVFGFDDHRSQPTFQLDFADALLELVRRGQTGVWHAAAEGEATDYDVARLAYEVLGAKRIDVKPLRRGADGRAALHPKYSVLDCSKLKALGVRVRPWKEALRAYLASVAK